MTHLQLFITGNEQENFIQTYSRLYDMKGCLQTMNGHCLFLPQLVSWREITDGDTVHAVFLYPSAQRIPEAFSFNDYPPQYLGWVHIDLGCLSSTSGQRILTMTTFAAENSHNGTYKSAYQLKAFRKRALSSLHYGVFGENIKFGGRSFYKDIGYSQSTLQSHQEGVKWKQVREGNVEFFPPSIVPK